MFSFEYTSYDLTLAVTVFLLTLVALLLLKAFATHQLKRLKLKERLHFLGYVEHIVKATRLPFLIGISLLAGISQLDFPTRIDRGLHFAWIIILVTQIALWGTRIISLIADNAFLRQRENDPDGATHLVLAGMVGRIILWMIATLIILDNLGFNVSTLVASLGIGGIAVALAVQNVLGDIFSSVSIALDKPFVIGDFIVVDSYMGTVEYVGMKTTRLRSLSGEQIIFSNTELLKNRIRNYKRMQERRVVFEFGIAYETPLEQIERIPEIAKKIVTGHQFNIRFDRAHFKSYADGALQFEVVYYVLDPDYNAYMDIQQAINLALLKQLRSLGISFAYPTRTLHVVSPGMNHDPNRDMNRDPIRDIDHGVLNPIPSTV